MRAVLGGVFKGLSGGFQGLCRDFRGFGRASEGFLGGVFFQGFQGFDWGL